MLVVGVEYLQTLHHVVHIIRYIDNILHDGVHHWKCAGRIPPLHAIVLLIRLVRVVYALQSVVYLLALLYETRKRRDICDNITDLFFQVWSLGHYAERWRLHKCVQGIIDILRYLFCLVHKLLFLSLYHFELLRNHLVSGIVKLLHHVCVTLWEDIQSRFGNGWLHRDVFGNQLLHSHSTIHVLVHVLLGLQL